MFKKLMYMVILFAAVLMFSCSTKPTIIITEAQVDKKVDVAVNTVFAVKLKGQLGTGYSWKIVSKLEGFELIGKPEVVTLGEKKTSGTDYQIFNFMAKKVGQWELKLNYLQPWKKGVKPYKTFKSVINIQAPIDNSKEKK
ncbi:protease inhibitor I42 family protein [Spirochaetota bacterium]